MKLYCKQYSTLGDPLVILHGLYGNGGNWGWHARQLAQRFAVYTLDARNHGQSPWADTMQLTEMAADVAETLQALGMSAVHLLGHSMGGKIAMLLALQQPALVRKLIVVDIAPVVYSKENDVVLESLCAIDVDKLQSRAAADKYLAMYIDTKSVRDFLLANLQCTAQGNFKWRINLPVIAKYFSELTHWPDTIAVFDGESLFIKGDASNYILPAYQLQTLALFPQSRLKIVEGAGHWVHSEKPEAVQKLIHNFLQI